MKAYKSLAILMTGGSLLTIASGAHAQAAADAGRSASAEEIIVTGSRVITNGNNAPTPVTVMDVSAALTTQPTIVADALNQLPVFSGSQSQTTTPGSTSAAATSSQLLNLRNFGPTRTLILYDGHRVAPTSIASQVDANMIPQMLLQRVDVVTGGASAVYGSDAITGVVNFITDTKFTGIKLKAQAGISTYGDGGTQDVGVAIGKSFADGRGHFEASYEFFNDAGISARSAREWGRQVLTVQNTAAGFVLVRNSRLTNTSFGGLIVNGPFANQTFADNGSISPLVRGTQITSTIDSGGGGGYQDGSLKASLRAHQVFARLDYDLTENIHAYAAASGTFNYNEQFQNYITLNKVAISATNPYLPTALQGTLAPSGSTTFQLSKLLSDAPRFNPRINERQLFVTGGLKGEVGSFRWDVNYSHSDNTTNYHTGSIVNNQKLFASLDSAKDANGQIVCKVTLTNPTLYPGCVPLNPFGPNSDSAAAVNYFTKTGEVSYNFNMEDISASIAGTAFNNWAGPVNVAVSTEYRVLDWFINSNVLSTDTVDCTGISICSTTGLWSAPTSRLAPVSQKVWEGAVEVDFPLLADVPFAKSLNLNGAARYTHYNTSGVAVTWKGGLDWHVNDELKFRGTLSRDIRAPNMTELFAAPTTVQIPTQDLLIVGQPTNVTPNVFGGNPNLKPEVALTYTAGVVYRPNWFPGFSISLDAYRIRVKDALTSVSGSNRVFQQICYDSKGTSPYCQLQVRPLGNYTDTSAANAATKWLNASVNIAQQVTYGLDIEANYVGTMFSRPFAWRTLVSYQPMIRYEQAGVTTINMSGVAFNSNNTPGAPEVRIFSSLHFSPVENVSVDVTERWRSNLKFGPDGTGTFLTGKVPSVAYTNLTLTFKAGQAEFFLNSSNLFNKQPPAVASTGQSGQVGNAGGFVVGDDPVGRTFTAGVRVKL
jgi:outer membrane receptor protein involved in Fe transport